MSQIKEFLDNKKENQMIFTVYTPDSKPKERIFKDFDEIKKYAGITSAGHFFREGGVSPDGVVRLDPANDYTMQFLKEEAAIEEYTYSNGNFIEDLLPNFNKILEDTSPVSEKDYILLNEKLKENKSILPVTLLQFAHCDHEYTKHQCKIIYGWNFLPIW